MKIHPASDLHLDLLPALKGSSRRIIQPIPGTDVLVLAGDIHEAYTGIEQFANWQDGTEVIYVAGNHEYYEHVLGPTEIKMREHAAELGVHFLERDVVVIKGVRFLGATLWTDYKLHEPAYTSAEAGMEAERRLNDHRLIHSGRRLFTSTDALAIHNASRTWLKEELAKPFDGKTVVVTHHGPHPLSVHPRYSADLLSAAFVSNLSELMPSVDLWVHGHVHDSFDYQVGRCRVVANPSGYVLNRRAIKSLDEALYENKHFKPNLIVEV